MRRSIATVSLSGTLPEKLDGRRRRAASTRVEIFENDLLYFDGSPARGPAAWRRISASRIALFQPFRDFEGVAARRAWRATSTAPSASST